MPTKGMQLRAIGNMGWWITLNISFFVSGLVVGGQVT